MGQQQLLLLVLGVVIVGVALVVGITAYSENGMKLNHDSLLSDATRIAIDLETWAQRPALFGGPYEVEGGLYGVQSSSVNLTRFFNVSAYSGEKISSGGICYTNVNGIYMVVGGGTSYFEVWGVNLAYKNLVVLRLPQQGEMELAQSSLGNFDASESDVSEACDAYEPGDGP